MNYVNLIFIKEEITMLENKKTQFGGIHYSRYIMSWRHTGCDYFGEEFEEWLRSEKCSEDEIRDIMEMALNGKLELERSAEEFAKKKRIGKFDKETQNVTKKKRGWFLDKTFGNLF